jgi:glycosyltransferase involved in cell wall biosynthesis
MERPIVSVIIPVYNKCKYVKETVNSVLEQDFESFEIIVVDDGSTDDSLKVVKSIKDQRLHIFSQSNAGVECARNFGFSKSVGPFVVFLDADDLMSGNRLRKQIDLFNATKDLVLAGTWASVIDHCGNIIGSIRPPTSNAALQIAHLFRNQFVNSSVMIKRSALENDVVFNETRGKRFAEDFDLWLRITKNGQVANIPEKLTAYRRLNASRSQSVGSSFLESARDISAEWLHLNTSRFESITSARSFVMSINGLDDLSPSVGCNLKATLQTYKMLMDDLRIGNSQEISDEHRKVMRKHKSHIAIWCLVGKFPVSLQRNVFSLLNHFKSSQFALWIVARMTIRTSKKVRAEHKSTL